MRCRFFLNVFSLLVLVSSSSVAGQSQSYFRKIVLLGRAGRIEGRYALSDTAWAETGVYRFSYDNGKRPDSIEYFVMGEPHPDPVFGVERIAFSYSDGRVERRFEDARGDLVTNSMKVCSQVLELDSGGRATTVLNRDAAGRLCNDEFGIAEIRFMRIGSPDTVSSTSFGKSGDTVRAEIDIFDSVGNTREIEFRETGLDTSHDIPAVVRYAYDDSGDLTFRQVFGEGGSPIKIGPDSRKYDPVGDRYIALSAYELRNVRTEWKYDKDGNLIEEDDFGYDGRLTGKARYVYDTNDRLTKLAYFDGGGKITHAVGDWGQGKDVPPPDFYPVDKEPQVVDMPEAAYPDLAQRAGLAGRVFVKIWVDENGNPRKALVLLSDHQVFDQPCIDAAMKAKFTPAMMNGKPVPVWVVVPYTFKLRSN